MFGWLLSSNTDDTSYDAGQEAECDWYESSESGIHPSAVPDTVVRHMARQRGHDEEDYLEGWRDGNKETERVEKVTGWISRITGW